MCAYCMRLLYALTVSAYRMRLLYVSLLYVGLLYLPTISLPPLGYRARFTQANGFAFRYRLRLC